MSNLLLDERPLVLLPSLVKEYGFERATILQQVHWLCNQPKIGVTHDGYKWVWGKYEELCEEYFPFWEPRTLRYHVSKLEKEGVLISDHLKSDKWDRTKFYRIDYTKLVTSMCQHVDTSIGQQVDTSIGQQVDGSLYTKTSSKSSRLAASPNGATSLNGSNQSTLFNDDSLQPRLETEPSSVTTLGGRAAEPNMFGAICGAIGWDHRTLDEASRGQVAQTVGIFNKAGYVAADVSRWFAEVWSKDWRWVDKHDYPTIKQLRQEIGKVRKVEPVVERVIQEDEPSWLK